MVHLQKALVARKCFPRSQRKQRRLFCPFSAVQDNFFVEQLSSRQVASQAGRKAASDMSERQVGFDLRTVNQTFQTTSTQAGSLTLFESSELSSLARSLARLLALFVKHTRASELSSFWLSICGVSTEFCIQFLSPSSCTESLSWWKRGRSFSLQEKLEND